MTWKRSSMTSPAAYSDGLVRPDERTSAGLGSGSAWLRPEASPEARTEGDTDGSATDSDAGSSAAPGTRDRTLRSPAANGTVWLTTPVWLTIPVWLTTPVPSAPSATCLMPPTACTRHGCSTYVATSGGK